MVEILLKFCSVERIIAEKFFSPLFVMYVFNKSSYACIDGFSFPRDSVRSRSHGIIYKQEMDILSTDQFPCECFDLNSLLHCTILQVANQCSYAL